MATTINNCNVCCGYCEGQCATLPTEVEVDISLPSESVTCPSNCDDINGTYTLTVVGTNCTWQSAATGGGNVCVCGTDITTDATLFLRLTYNTGANEWELEIFMVYNAGNPCGGGGWEAAVYTTTDEWDCNSTLTLDRISGTGCDWPATIDVNPV